MGLLKDVRWLYGLALVPFATDWLERGRFPSTPRESLAEMFLGVIITGVILLVCRQHARILALADKDPSTELLNARRFREDLAREMARSSRMGLPLCLAYLDLDRFKSVNDRFGHARGDEVLSAFARQLERRVRWGVDRCYRIGGDEFAVVLPGVNREQALEIVERLRIDATAEVLEGVGAGVSAGIAEMQPDERSSSLIRRADAQMYEVKPSVSLRQLEQV